MLYAPGWLRTTPSPLAQQGAGPLGAYRTVTREQAKARWLNGVPEGKQAKLIPPGWFEQWADATWATDPAGAKLDPPVVRAPNGTVADTGDLRQDDVRSGQDHRADADRHRWIRTDTPPPWRRRFPLLVNSPGKRLVILPRARTT
jgi:hypothetical protein